MFKEDGDDATSTLMGDFTMNGLLMFVMMLLLLLPFIADPRKKLDAMNIDPPHPGQLRVEIFWPDGQDIDVDLWVKGPIGSAVGYSNQGGPLFNLLRDDLGGCQQEDYVALKCRTLDASGRNMETAYTRGIWDGEYIVNAHLYSLKQGKLPVPVRAIVSFKKDEDSPSEELVVTNTELKFEGNEITIFRFMIEGGQPDMTTLNSLPIKIRPMTPRDGRDGQ